MSFLRCSFFSICVMCLLAVLAPRMVPVARVRAQETAPQSAQAQASAAPAYSLPPDKLAKAIRLSRIRYALNFAGGLWEIAVLWLLLATGTAARLEAWTRRRSARHWVQGAWFFAAFVAITALAGLPLDWFGELMEKSYQVSVQSWAGWLGDQAKALGLSLLIATPILLLFNRIVRRWPRRYWLGAWAVSVPLMALAIFVSPLLDPIFNKFEPLSKNYPGLVTKLEEVVARTGTKIPPDRMYLMKASLKTNGLNAYVTGFGATKRIVVWDTTAGRIPDDEILFIFAHETGHYVLHHIPKTIAGTAVGLFFVFWGCARLADWLARRFGARWKLDTGEGEPPLAGRAGFLVLLLTVSIAGFVLQPVNNAFSRHFEHQADVYGQEAVHGIVPDPQKTAVAAFNDLGKAWLEDPDPSPLVEFWEFNHPSVQSRASFAQHYNPWANGGRGEFFRSSGQ